MTQVSDDPSLWLDIYLYRVASYFAVAGSVGVFYDWVLTFGQEVELIWRQRWSLMTVLYLSVRYLGIAFAVLQIPGNIPTISVTDTVSWILYAVLTWMSVIVFPMLRVIMIARLHAMYQRSRKVLIFLIVTFLADTIFNVVAAVMSTRHTSGEELILSGTYVCSINYGGTILLDSVTWILGTAWEAFALCLAVWIAVKHFRELRQHSAGGIIRDGFTVLIKSHVLYFASFVVVSCFHLIIFLDPTISADPVSIEIVIELLQIATVVQLFVLGPRLILGVREYHAKLVADSGAATSMTSIAFQERLHISTGNGV
ncbi:hypothetical protein EV702DRAFT_455966 [Suillus placidus]|uniref:DUF6533 domain-containing protein n=1 Tax=Suillus placidus TaxID=48579 RepID=A0A9P6ZS88_9AGAM|nr:hypothetical protein EV702DRAFT_455966 [Suillus placidus]